MRIQFTTRAQVDEYIASDLIECLECGKKFQFLGAHLQRKHDISCDEYRELWGLPAMTPLAGLAYRATHREKLSRFRADGRVNNDHLPAAVIKAASVPRIKIGVAKAEYAACTAKIRPGDARKLARGAKRADGRDADNERSSQQRRRAAKSTPENLMHQQKIYSIIEKLTAVDQDSPTDWLCGAMEITPEIMSGWLAKTGTRAAITPPSYAIKYMEILCAQRLLERTMKVRYTKNEDAFLIENYALHGTSWCAARMNRTEMSVKTRALKIGLNYARNDEWTADQDDVIRQLYPSTAATAIARKIDRTAGAIVARALLLGINRLKKNGLPRKLRQPRSKNV